MSALRGLCAFPITPADAAGRVDAAALGRLIDRILEAGADSLGVLGSTGVYMYLTREERRRALETAQARCGGRIPLVAGVGALRTDDAIRCAQDAKAIGASVGLLSAASYAPLSQEEVFAHVSAVARESGLPICLYDNPATTRFAFSPDLVFRLSRTPGVVGVKNPPPEGGVAEHLARQRAGAAEGFAIGYSGDWICAEAMIAGADVWFSVLGGIFPGVCLELVRAAQAGEAAEARRLDAALAPVWGLFRKHSSLRVVYEIARRLDLSMAEPPRPIQPVDEAGRAEIAEVLRALPPEIAR